MACLVSSSCASTNVPVLTETVSGTGKSPQLYKDEAEIWAVADRIESQLDCNGCEDFLYPDKELDAYLHAIATKLMARSTEADAPNVRVRVFKSPTRNAFVLPNGALYVTTGMLGLMQSEDQLATVISHELVHFLHRHSLKEQRHRENQLKWSSALVTLATGSGVNASTLAAISSLGGYSRELETEADTLGFHMLVAGGYDPGHAPVIFERILAEDKADEDEPRAYASHPKMRDRVASYGNLVANWNGNVKFERIRDPSEFVALTDRVFLDNIELAIAFGMRDIVREQLLEYLERNPTDARAFFLMGELERDATQDNDGVALAMYVKAIELGSAPAAAYRAAALICRARGDQDSAANYFHQYLQVAPDAADAPIVRKYLATAQEETNGVMVDMRD